MPKSKTVASTPAPAPEKAHFPKLNQVQNATSIVQKSAQSSKSVSPAKPLPVGGAEEASKNKTGNSTTEPKVKAVAQQNIKQVDTKIEKLNQRIKTQSKIINSLVEKCNVTIPGKTPLSTSQTEHKVQKLDKKIEKQLTKIKNIKNEITVTNPILLNQSEKKKNNTVPVAAKQILAKPAVVAPVPKKVETGLNKQPNKTSLAKTKTPANPAVVPTLSADSFPRPMYSAKPAAVCPKANKTKSTNPYADFLDFNFKQKSSTTLLGHQAIEAVMAKNLTSTKAAPVNQTAKT